jgi:molybdopterin molybdotransferase
VSRSSVVTTRGRTAAHVSWHDARALARREGARLRELAGLDILPIARAHARTLAHDLFALVDLPAASSSAMDGWAISGAGPWRLGEAIRAGDAVPREPLVPGTARAVATGAPIPPATTAVLRSEDGDVRRVDGAALLHRRAGAEAPRAGHHIRLAGEEARRGEPILPAGTVLTPPRLALAAVAGFDEVTVVGRPQVDLVVFGDELRSRGIPADGETRDAFLPALPSAIAGAGGRHASTRFGRDSHDATVAALREASAPLVVSTGGTARGPADFVRPALDAIGARITCDGVAVRPGHPVIMARFDDGRLFLGLPGNPLAAMLVFASLGLPLLAGMTGRAGLSTAPVVAGERIVNVSNSTRLVPCTVDERGAVPTPWQGTAMLRGLAAADVVAVVPAGGAEPGTVLETLELPW